MFGLNKQRKNGLQLYHFDLPGVSCNITQADDQLSYLVDYYWKLSITFNEIDLPIIPDNAIDLVVSPEIEQFAALYMPVDKSFKIPLKGPIVYAGISFHPEAATGYFGLTLDQLKQLGTGVGTINRLQIQSLLAAVQSVLSLSEMAEIFNAHLLQACNNEHVTHSYKILELLNENTGANCIANIAKLAGLSERQLRRVADHTFGLGPKKLQRVIRLQQTLHGLFQANNALLSDTFYDDSHRIRELKRMTGLTPGQIRSLAEIYNTPK